MIHYSCDRCRKTIDPKEEVRYVVRVEAHAAIEPQDDFADDTDRDYLGEIQDMLEMGSSDDDALADDDAPARSATFDLCPACFQKFVRNPLGCETHAQLGFSTN
ncbi:MAG: hypothetical protein FJ297_10905 [Planctomycetes bacterium]|nr:hypothetical protein [Planctomycetota bacterium]